MSETLLRQWTMLQLVPRHPGSLTTKQIAERLGARGYAVNQRTVQRDLNELAREFPLTCNDERKPFRWYWAPGAAALSLPGMDAPTALAFYLADEFLRDILPSQVRGRIQAHVQQARQVLQASGQDGVADWPSRVVVIPPGQRLLAPDIEPSVMDAVTDALLNRRMLRLTYRPRSRGGEPVEHRASPLGLVVRAHVTYLVCDLHKGPDPSHMAAHRIVSAKMLPEPATKPSGFDLEDYIRKGSFDYLVGDTITLVARFEPMTAYHLYESPLAADQEITEEDDDWVRITATVQDTQQLRWWLRGFGQRVEVLAPKQLRNEIIATLREASIRYPQPS